MGNFGLEQNFVSFGLVKFWVILDKENWILLDLGKIMCNFGLGWTWAKLGNFRLGQKWVISASGKFMDNFGLEKNWVNYDLGTIA